MAFVHAVACGVPWLSHGDSNRFVSGALRFLQLGIEQTVRHEAGSAVPGCFLRELHAGGESEFGVDVGEVGLYGAR